MMRRQWRMWLSEVAWEVIVVAAADHHPVEIGGVLVGVGVRGRPWVTDAVVVPSEKQTPVYYELPEGARHDVVDEARKRDARLGYIGDWHAHPIDIGPSNTDLMTMRKLAIEQDSDCSRPVLLIARRTAGTYTPDPSQFTGRRLRELRVIATGPLPSLDERCTQHREWRSECGVPSRPRGN